MKLYKIIFLVLCALLVCFILTHFSLTLYRRGLLYQLQAGDGKYNRELKNRYDSVTELNNTMSLLVPRAYWALCLAGTVLGALQKLSLRLMAIGYGIAAAAHGILILIFFYGFTVLYYYDVVLAPIYGVAAMLLSLLAVWVTTAIRRKIKGT